MKRATRIRRTPTLTLAAALAVAITAMAVLVAMAAGAELRRDDELPGDRACSHD